MAKGKKKGSRGGKSGKVGKGKGKGKAKDEIVLRTTYFSKPGPQNTARVLDLAYRRAKALGVRTILVPSTSGRTGAEAVKRFSGLGVQVVVVTLHFGFRKKGEWTMEKEYVEEITRGGGCIFTCSHGFSGIERTFRERFRGIFSPGEILAYSLKYLFGQGLKVAIELGLMCADSGFAPVDEDVISLGGTHSGVDTAIVLRPSHMNCFDETRVKEIIAIPRDH